MINDYGKSKNENVVTLERDRFRPNWRRGEVITQNCQITYSPIYDKGKQDLIFYIVVKTTEFRTC